MQLMRERDVPARNSDRVFRYSRARAVVAYGMMAGGLSALFIAATRGHNRALQVMALIGLAAVFLSRRFLVARFRPSNWLVRETENGLYLHFRSHLNYHFSPDDAAVAFIPYREISRARWIREKRERPEIGHRQRMIVETRQVAELDLTCDTSAFTAALAEERARPAPREPRWYGTSAVKLKDYPIAVEGTKVQLVWQCVPGIRTFLDSLGRRVKLDDGAERSTSYQTTAAQTRADDEREIAALARSGQLRAAVAKAALVYMKEPAKAKEVIASLRRGEIPGDVAA